MTAAEALADNGIRLRSYGLGNSKTTCPKCSTERRNKADPCLSVKIDEKGFVANCHHCGWQASHVEREARFEPQPRKREPIEVPEVAPLPAHALTWFADRGIGEDTLDLCDVSWSPKMQAVAFPFRWPGQNEVVNAKFRRLPKGFSQTTGGDKLYWLLDHLSIENGDQVVIVEGEIDALSLVEAGVPNVISVPSGSPKQLSEGKGNEGHFAFIATTLEQLEPFSRIVIATDADEPGEVMAEELSRRYGRDKCWRVRFPEGCKDANDVLVQHGMNAVREMVRYAKAYPVEGIFAVEDYAEAVIRLYQNGQMTGASTGLPSLDKIYTIVPGQLTVVTGMPNHGKSELVDQLMVNLAMREHWAFGVCSFENEPESHIIKWAEKLTKMPFADGPTQRMSMSVLTQALTFAGDHFHLIRCDGEEGPTIDWALAKGKILVQRYGIKGLVIDPYNEVEHKRPAGMSETEYVSWMLTRVKRFAQTFGVHVWFIAHPRIMRVAPGDTIPAPSLYDIAGSANWVNKADCGLVAHRGEQFGTTEVYVRKCRFKWVGRQGIATLKYDRVTGRYDDMGLVAVE